ncbi:MAG: hypothetical protein KF720_09660 [Rubrivivax sp.]|nr:hypothetical protein [Rubrivivax sp.]
MPQPNASPAPADAGGLEPIISGTLTLLTHFARMPDLAVSERIACNLALIARHPQASPALQEVCAGLFTDWLGPLRLQDAPAGAEWGGVLPMPRVVQ